MKKKKKKKLVQKPFLGYCPNYIVKKKIVLQEWNCIAIKVGWLLGDLEILLQYNYCIAGEGW